MCGHYEGFDERIFNWVDEKLSVGDYVVTGGELPALMVLDAVARFIPGVLGKMASAEEDSFSTGLLEYPQYTRPVEFEGLTVAVEPIARFFTSSAASTLRGASGAANPKTITPASAPAPARVNFFIFLPIFYLSAFLKFLTRENTFSYFSRYFC